MAIGQQHKTENSRIQRKTVNGCTVFVKEYVPGGWRQTPETARRQAAREIEIAGRLPTLPDLHGRLGVMTIVESDSGSDAYPARVVTREVPGTSLMDVLRRAGRKTLRHSCVRAIYLAGKWLRIFQTLSTHDPETAAPPERPRNMVEYCDLRLDGLREYGYCWPSHSGRRRLLDWLQRRVERTADEQLRTVWSHGDYGPANLIWDGRVLTPIDFAACKPGFPLVDVTYLVHRLEMLPVQFPWRQWPLAAWRKACLRGYDCPDAESLPVYEALMARHLLCRLLTLVRRRPETGRERVHNAWVRNRVRAKLTRLFAKP